MEADKKATWFQKLWGKYKYVLLIALVGVVLLAWPERTAGSGTPQAPSSQDSEAEEVAAMEERMREVLARIDGVGALELMLSVESTDRLEFAVDTELRYSGQTAAPDDYSRRTETVVVSGSGGEDGPVAVRRISPAYRGALVVCEGGGDPEVKLAVTQAVSSLTGLSSDRIAVARMNKSPHT